MSYRRCALHILPCRASRAVSQGAATSAGLQLPKGHGPGLQLPAEGLHRYRRLPSHRVPGAGVRDRRRAPGRGSNRGRSIAAPCTKLWCPSPAQNWASAVRPRAPPIEQSTAVAHRRPPILGLMSSSANCTARDATDRPHALQRCSGAHGMQACRAGLPRTAQRTGHRCTGVPWSGRARCSGASCPAPAAAPCML